MKNDSAKPIKRIQLRTGRCLYSANRGKHQQNRCVLMPFIFSQYLFSILIFFFFFFQFVCGCLIESLFFLLSIHVTGTKNLLKWKGVMFAPETDDKTISEPATTTTSSEPDSSCCTTIATNPTPATEKDFDAIATDDEGHQVNGFLYFYIASPHVLYRWDL